MNDYKWTYFGRGFDSRRLHHFKMRRLLILTLLSCTVPADSFDKERFENTWWEIQEYPVCFNFHESGDLLSYKDQTLEEGQWGQFIDEGEWTFYEPNEYSVEDKTVFIFETEECWEIEGYFDNDNRIITACDCTILQMDID